MKMNEEPPLSHSLAQRKEGKGAACEARLNDLRNRNRLAIHVWEERKDPHSFPAFSWQALGEMPPEDIPARVASETAPLVSMSLLPNDASNSSLIPYMVMPGRLTKLAYLVDLDQGKEHPACVVYAHSGNIASGVSVHDKSFVLHDHTNIELLRRHYEPFDTQDAWIKQVAANRSDTEAQLDALGAWYAFQAEEKPRKHQVNEMLVAASHEHIAAIAVPHYDKKYYEWSSEQARQHETMLTLQGALAALDHINRGTDVPLVKYTVETLVLGKDAAKPGSVTYIAQGKKELTETVLACVKQLQQDKITLPREFDDYLQAMTGLSSAQPLHLQRSVVEQLRRKAGNSPEPARL